MNYLPVGGSEGFVVGVVGLVGGLVGFVEGRVGLVGGTVGLVGGRVGLVGGRVGSVVRGIAVGSSMMSWSTKKGLVAFKRIPITLCSPPVGSNCMIAKE